MWNGEGGLGKVSCCSGTSENTGSRTSRKVTHSAKVCASVRLFFLLKASDLVLQQLHADIQTPAELTRLLLMF